MKIALYARVSTEDQNLENQIMILEEHAKRNNWDFEIFKEKESTRKTRPVKYELMQKLRNKEFDGVCVLKMDRWARSTLELVTEVLELNNKGIQFLSIRENIDPTTAIGKLQMNIFAAFAEFEREIIRERTLDGLKRAKKQGKTLGRPKGKKDSKKRRKSGYYLRWSNSK